jgi:hypothetical protein
MKKSERAALEAAKAKKVTNVTGEVKKPKKLNKEEIQTLVASSPKKEKEKVAKLDKATAGTVVKKITSTKELMYKYPEEVADLKARKLFRAKTRKKLERLEKDLKIFTKNPDKGDAKKAEKEIAAFKKEFYQSK